MFPKRKLPETTINLHVYFHPTPTMEKLMTTLTDLATTFAASVASNSSANNAAAITAIQAQVADIVTNEKSDEDKITDLTNAITIGFSAPTPANTIPTPAPVTVTPPVVTAPVDTTTPPTTPVAGS